MAETNLAKTKKGYSYMYCDLAHIHEYLEEKGYSYYQTTATDERGVDYIFTTPIIDGKELPARRGCQVVQATLSGKSNPAQEQGSALTYARRYSLLMAFGLATEDDDAQCLTREEKKPAVNAAKPSEKKEQAPAKASAQTINEVQIDAIRSEMIRTGISEATLMYNVKQNQKAKISDMTHEDYVKAMQLFNNTPDKKEA